MLSICVSAIGHHGDDDDSDDNDGNDDDDDDDDDDDGDDDDDDGDLPSTPSPKASSVCTLSAGATFGESVLFGGKRTSSVETLEPSQLLVLPAHKLKVLCEKHPHHMAGPIPSLEKSEYTNGHTQVPIQDALCVHTCTALTHMHTNKRELQNGRHTDVCTHTLYMYSCVYTHAEQQ